MLIEVLTGKSSGRYTNATKSMALYNLKKISQMASNNSGNVSTKAHKSHLKTLINNTMKEIK